MKWALYRIPRILAIGFGVFVSLFALDSLSGDASVWEKLARLAVHLVPVGIYAIIVALAWRWEWVGAVLFAALGGVYVATMGRHRLDWNLTIAGPLFVLSALFLAGWLRRSRLRRR